MRNAFARIINEFAREDDRLVLLSGDIGNRMFEQFKLERPKNFYNCGVAEANMVSIAAGLAMTGFHPWVYTIASFLTYRPFEQIRIDVAYHHLPVILVGTGAGLSYASNGPTHHSLEDIAMFRSLGGFRIACPGDASEVVSCMKELRRNPGPAYLRLGKKGEPDVHSAPQDCPMGKAHQMRSGCDAAVLSTGNILPEAISACETLNKRGISVAHWHFPWVLPLDKEVLSDIFKQFSHVVTVEEHCIDGGFGSLVAECLAEKPTRNARLLRLGLPRRFVHETTQQGNARKKYRIDAMGISEQLEVALSGSYQRL